MAKLTKDELKDLEAAGYVEGNMTTFPENVSPVLRAKALEAWTAKQEGEVTALDMPTAVDRQNELARERAAGDDKVDPLDHDNNGRKGGAKRQIDAAN